MGQIFVPGSGFLNLLFTTAKSVALAPVALGILNPSAGIALAGLYASVLQATVFRPDVPPLKSPDQQLDLTTDPNRLRPVVYGRAAVGGNLEFAGVPDTNKRYLYAMIALAGHECDDIEAVVWRGVKYPLNTISVDDGSEPDGGIVGACLPAVAGLDDPAEHEGFWRRFRVWKYLGTDDQAASSILMNRFPEWTADHRARGVTYVVVRWEHGAPFDTGGIGLQDLYWIVRGRKVYDPRLDSTQGGSGSQRIYDPSTWVWSDNCALAMLDFVKGVTVGSRLVAGVGHFPPELYGPSPPTLPSKIARSLDTYRVAAISCGALEPRADLEDGTPQADEQRYSLNIAVEGGSDAQVLDLMAEHMAGFWVPDAGAIRVYSGHGYSPVATITDRMFLVSAPVEKPFAPQEALANQALTTYVSRDLYREDDAPIVEDAAAVLDEGEVSVSVALPGNDSPSRGQRIGAVKIRKSRRGHRWEYDAPFDEPLAQVGEVVDVTETSIGMSQVRVRIVSDTVYAADGDRGPVRRIEFEEWPNSLFDWDVGDEVASPNPGLVNKGGLILEAPAITSFTGTEVTVSGIKQPAIDVEVTADPRASRVFLEYRQDGATVYNLVQELIRQDDGTWIGTLTNLLAETDYDGRAVASGNNLVRSGYSSVSTATAGEIEIPGSVGADGDDGADAITAQISASSAVLPADLDGTVDSGEIAAFEVFLKVFKGGADVTAAATLSKVSDTPSSGYATSIATSGGNKGRVTLSTFAASVDTGVSIYRAQYTDPDTGSPYSFDVTLRLTKAKRGAQTADEITYDGGETVESLKPNEPAADVTENAVTLNSNVRIDVNNSGARPAGWNLLEVQHGQVFTFSDPTGITPQIFTTPGPRVWAPDTIITNTEGIRSVTGALNLSPAGFEARCAIASYSSTPLADGAYTVDIPGSTNTYRDIRYDKTNNDGLTGGVETYVLNDEYRVTASVAVEVTLTLTNTAFPTFPGAPIYLEWVISYRNAGGAYVQVRGPQDEPISLPAWNSGVSDVRTLTTTVTVDESSLIQDGMDAGAGWRLQVNVRNGFQSGAGWSVSSQITSVTNRNLFFYEGAIQTLYDATGGTAGPAKWLWLINSTGGVAS